MNRTLLALVTWALAAGAGRADDLFNQQIAPLLRTKCQGCHGDDPKLRGGLDVRSRAALLKGGASGPAVAPGDAARSLLYQSVLRTGELVMPPKESARLTPAEMAVLKTWIDAGAAWEAARVALDPADAWAYLPVARPVPPGRGSASPVDAFIDAALTARQVAPAPPAERATLIRRASFDLTGLPPAPEQVEAFVRDAAPDAFARLLETLLASPRYGERMAQHWLDVVRYADTGGFANDYERPTAWRYRDYVIRSFNADKPYDRFVLEQVAGDELGADAREGPIAVGFLRMGPWEHTGMSVAALTRQMWLDDVTNSVGVTFLGQGLNCCRCHDHKFDPLPTQDYYRVQALFAGTHFTEAPTAFLAEENTADFAATRADVQR